MKRVLRWGLSAYETAEDLARERSGTIALGLAWDHVEGREPPAALERAEFLVVTSGVRVDEAALARFSGDVVLTTTSGYDHIDLQACDERGVAVLRLPEARRDAVVEHSLCAMISLMRGVPTLEREGREGRWSRGMLPALAPVGLRGSRIGVIGLGVIGKRMAEVLTALGAEVVGYDPLGVPEGVHAAETMEQLLEGADAITLHCSLTESSRGLISAARLERLQPHAVVVNTARGEVLDVEAAIERVGDGHLRGVAADVFPEEPYPRLAEAMAVPGVLFTPHASGFTRDLGRRVADGVLTALKAWTMGQPLPNRVG